MQTKPVWSFLSVAPIVASTIGIVVLPVYASEPPASQTAEQLTADDLSPVSLEVKPRYNLPNVEALSTDTSVVFHPWTDTAAETEKTLSSQSLTVAQTDSISVSSELELISSALRRDEPSTPFVTVSEGRVLDQVEGGAIADPPIDEDRASVQQFATSSSYSEALLQNEWHVAQVETPAELDTTDEVSPDLENPPNVESEDASSPRWLFSFSPYAFVPLSVGADVTVRDLSADFSLGLDDVLSPLNFAAAGRFEAWNGNLGLIFDGAYFSLGQDSSRSFSVSDCFCDIFPSEIKTEVNVQYGQFDLGVGYRVAENASSAVNDFELGPLVFDAVVGVRIYALQQEIDVSTDISTGSSREESETLIAPMASGRFRWNVSPTFAGWVRTDLAGFGLGGTLVAISVTGGIDWMFSGNTSLLLAYRFSNLQYNGNVKGEDFELDLSLHGPYMGVVFRF